MALTVQIIPILEDNYAYIIQSADVVGVIDPGESGPIIDYLKQNDLALDWIINTHHHWDHVDGNEGLKQIFPDVQIAAPDECRFAKDIILKHDDMFQFGDVAFHIIETPGHTMGHIVLFEPKEKILFSADTLFVMGCGRVFEGTMDDMFLSMQRIKQLPPETLIYCGHDYTAANVRFVCDYMPDNDAIKQRAMDLTDISCPVPSRLSEELQTNPFLMAETVNAFARARLAKDKY